MSDWADAKAGQLLALCTWTETMDETCAKVAQALRDVQRDTAAECLRLAEALYDADGVTNERICAAIRERFLKEGE